MMRRRGFLTRVLGGLPSAGFAWAPQRATRTSIAPASVLHQVGVTVAHDDILSLPSTYHPLVPAPGLDRRLIFGIGQVTCLFDAVGYLSVDPGAYVMVVYGDWTADASAPADFHGHLNQCAALSPLSYVDTTIAFGGVKGRTSIENDVANVTNQPFTLTAYNGQNFTAGHPANTMRVAFDFRVYDEAANRFLTTDESHWNPDTRTFG